MRWLFYFLIVLTLSCSQGTSHKDDNKTLIVCTTGMIGDAIFNMVDHNSRVEVLMGPGTDPHLFKPTKASLDLLSEADIIIANGLHLEGKMQDILKKMSLKKPVYFLGEYLDPDKLILADSASKVYDPHIWFDVNLWNESLSMLSEDLKEAQVLNQVAFHTYSDQLNDLNKWIKTEISELPSEKRILVTAHDAFSYFGRAYEIEVIGLQGISTVSEYGLRDVSNLVNTIVNKKVPAVFIESSISPRAIEAVIRGCESKGFETELGGTLYSDALGGTGSGADTYLLMVRHNVLTIKNSLK